MNTEFFEKLCSDFGLSKIRRFKHEILGFFPGIENRVLIQQVYDNFWIAADVNCTENGNVEISKWNAYKIDIADKDLLYEQMKNLVKKTKMVLNEVALKKIEEDFK